MKRIISAAIGCSVGLVALAGGCWGTRHDSHAARLTNHRVLSEAPPAIVEPTIAPITLSATPAHHPSEPDIPTFMQVYETDTPDAEQLATPVTVPVVTPAPEGEQETRTRQLPPIVTLADTLNPIPPLLAQVTLPQNNRATHAAVVLPATKPTRRAASLARRSLHKPTPKGSLSLLPSLLEHPAPILASMPPAPSLEMSLDEPITIRAPAIITAAATGQAREVAFVPAARDGSLQPIIPAVSRRADEDLWRVVPKTSQASRVSRVTIRYADEPQLISAPRKLVFPRIRDADAVVIISTRTRTQNTRLLPKNVSRVNQAKLARRDASDEVWVQAALSEPSLDYTAPPPANGFGLFQK